MKHQIISPPFSQKATHRQRALLGNILEYCGYSYINALIGCAVLLSFALLLFLLELFDALLQHIGPKVTLKVRQLLGTGQAVFSRLLEDVLWGWRKNKVRILQTAVKQ